MRSSEAKRFSAPTGYWRVARDNSTKMEGQKTGARSRSRGPSVAMFIETKGKASRLEQKKTKFLTKWDVCLCWLGCFVGLGNEWRR